MANLNHKGPEGQGPKTGRKLGKCKKTDDELKQIGEIETGQRKRHHSKNFCGKGKRMRYFKTINKKGE